MVLGCLAARQCLGFRQPAVARLLLLEVPLCTLERRKGPDSGSVCESLQTANTDHLLLLHPSAVFTKLLLRNRRGDKEV